MHVGGARLPSNVLGTDMPVPVTAVADVAERHGIPVLEAKW
jgi:hypothetical protein